MRISITDISDPDIWTQDIPGDFDIATVKMLYCQDFNKNGNDLTLTFNSNPLRDELQTLAQAGITEDSLLYAIPQSFIQSQRLNQPVSSDTGTVEGFMSTARQLLRESQTDREVIARFDQQWPAMAEALRKKDLTQIASLVKRKNDEEMAVKARLRNAYANPNTPENRKIIEDHENQKLIDDSLALAMEESPEMFGTVIMLYIRCRINGKDIKGFVDSGAQMTIMSAACAQKCDLMKLVDKRFAGVAQGVGTQKILGRVHTGQIQIENDFIGTTFSILENQSMDLIIGLDLLKRHQCQIDLMGNRLVIGSTGTATGFLSEADLPKHARLTQAPSETAVVQDIEDMEIQNAINQSRADQPGSSNPPTQSPGGAHAENKIRQVMEMAQCDRALAMEVLEESNGDANSAALKLLTSNFAGTNPRKRSRQN